MRPWKRERERHHKQPLRIDSGISTQKPQATAGWVACVCSLTDPSRSNAGAALLIEELSADGNLRPNLRSINIQRQSVFNTESPRSNRMKHLKSRPVNGLWVGVGAEYRPPLGEGAVEGGRVGHANLAAGEGIDLWHTWSPINMCTINMGRDENTQSPPDFGPNPPLPPCLLPSIFTGGATGVEEKPGVG